MGEQNIKKLCNFYVSDLHLSVMLLPYISKQLNEDVEITTIFEKLKKENIEEILDKLNVKNKEKILKINWFNNHINKSQETIIDKEIEKIIKNTINNHKKIMIIIGGNKNFVEKNNKKIMEYLHSNQQYTDIKIIDCYDIEEVGADMKLIANKYDGILNTSGEILI